MKSITCSSSIIAFALGFVDHSEAFSVVGRKSTASCCTFIKAVGNDNEPEKKSIGLSGLFQLITAGMGSPFLGDFEGVDEETGKIVVVVTTFSREFYSFYGALHLYRKFHVFS